MTLPVETFHSTLKSDLEDRSGLTGVQVEDYWPGGDTDHEGIYLGDLTSGEGPSGVYVPTQIKTGRQKYDADDLVPFTCQTWLAGETPDAAGDARQRALVLFGEVVDAIQANPAMSQAVDWVPSISYRTVYIPHGPGWACRVVGAIALHARLT